MPMDDMFWTVQLLPSCLANTRFGGIAAGNIRGAGKRGLEVNILQTVILFSRTLIPKGIDAD